jgi:hypothetical protein
MTVRDPGKKPSVEFVRDMGVRDNESFFLRKLKM